MKRLQWSTVVLLSTPLRRYTVENIDIPVTETTEIDEDTAAEAAKEVTESAVEPSPDKDDPVKNQHRQGSQKSTADDIFGTQWCVPDFPS